MCSHVHLLHLDKLVSTHIWGWLKVMKTRNQINLGLQWSPKCLCFDHLSSRFHCRRRLRENSRCLLRSTSFLSISRWTRSNVTVPAWKLLVHDAVVVHILRWLNSTCFFQIQRDWSIRLLSRDAGLNIIFPWLNSTRFFQMQRDWSIGRRASGDTGLYIVSNSHAFLV